MSEFLVESYAPRESAVILAARVEELALALEQVSEPGADIRLLGAVFVPDDEICFYLCQAASADTVRAAVAHARLPFDRIAEAVSIRPSEADSCSA